MSLAAKLAPLILSCAALLLCGCGGGPPPTGTLVGKVAFTNKTPLKVGDVTVVSEDGKRRALGRILTDDGTYLVEKAPAGKVRVAVSTQDPKTLPLPPAKAPPGVPPDANTVPEEEKQELERLRRYFVPLPAKYADPSTSGLSTTVEADKDTRYDITLQK